MSSVFDVNGANTYRISAVTFGNDWVEINFYEENDVSDDVVDIKQRLIKPDLFQDEFLAIYNTIVDVLDRAAIHRRNPVETFEAPADVEVPDRSTD